MAFLTREQLLSIDDITPTIEAVAGPGGQGQVGVRILTAGERDAFLDLIGQAEDGRVKNLKVILCTLTLCDEQGGRLFAQDEVEALAGKSSEFIERVFDTAKRISQLGDDATEEAKKNSAPTPGAASGTGSPSDLADTVSATGSASLMPES